MCGNILGKKPSMPAPVKSDPLPTQVEPTQDGTDESMRRQRKKRGLSSNYLASNQTALGTLAGNGGTTTGTSDTTRTTLG